MNTSKGKIGIINSGFANIYSVVNAIAHLGYDSSILSTCEDLQREHDVYILPGVGSFHQVKDYLVENGLFDEIKSSVESGQMKLIGICLGMQLLLAESEESPIDQFVEGFGFVGGKVEMIPKHKVDRLPHIGWNKLYSQQEHVFEGLDVDNLYVYFVHSFYGVSVSPQNLIAHTELGEGVFIPAIVQNDQKNVLGIQFHPERSGTAGLKILDNSIQYLANL